MVLVKTPTEKKFNRLMKFLKRKSDCYDPKYNHLAQIDDGSYKGAIIYEYYHDNENHFPKPVSVKKYIQNKKNKAMTELGNRDGKTFDSTEELFDELDDKYTLGEIIATLKAMRPKKI